MNISDTPLRKAGAVIATGALSLSLFFSAGSVFAAPPVVPVITTFTQSTSTNPIMLAGTADADTTIMVTGGASPVMASSTVSGTWSLSVSLNANALNSLAVVSLNNSGEVSATSTLDITHDSIAPSAPVVTFPTTPHSTSTSPIRAYGTAEASSTVVLTGGWITSTTTVNGSGEWSTFLNLLADTDHVISVTATDVSGNTSTATTLDITHSSSGTSTPATSTPVITLSGNATMSVFSCNGFIEPGFSAVDSLGASISASSTGSVNIQTPGSYTLFYVATDTGGNTAISTRTVNVLECNSGGGGSSGDSSSSSVASGNVIANMVPEMSPIASSLSLSGFAVVSAGEVLGASTNTSSNFIFNNNLTVGSRGEEVMALQTRLMAAGYFSGPATGYFGPLTKAAVMKFQSAHGVSATGYFGPLTRAVINS